MSRWVTRNLQIGGRMATPSGTSAGHANELVLAVRSMRESSHHVVTGATLHEQKDKRVSRN